MEKNLPGFTTCFEQLADFEQNLEGLRILGNIIQKPSISFW